jgi:hypothetical protein
MMVTGSHGVRMQYDYTQDIGGLAGPVSVASPRWLRLTRSGDTITGYDSADGTRWTEVATADLAGLPATVQAGLFATSPDAVTASQSLGTASSSGDSTLATGIFDNVALSGGRPGGTWAGTAIGGTAQSGEGFQQADGRFTVTGSGDIAPLPPVAGSSNSGPLTTIEQPCKARSPP